MALADRSKDKTDDALIGEVVEKIKEIIDPRWHQRVQLLRRRKDRVAILQRLPAWIGERVNPNARVEHFRGLFGIMVSELTCSRGQLDNLDPGSFGAAFVADGGTVFIVFQEIGDELIVTR